MWKKPWNLKEGFLIGAGLIVCGLVLQFSVRPIEWKAFAYPVNLLMAVLIVLVILLAYALRSRSYAIRFMGSYAAAIPTLVYTVILTAIMGLTRQVADGQEAVDFFGITHMLSFWPFVLIYVYIAIILGLVILQHLTHFKWKRDIPFLLNHLGLFIVLLSATLGNADMQRLTMTVTKEQPEWRAIDNQGYVKELPIAIQLNDFTIDEYPPKLLLVDHTTGQALPAGNPVSVVADSAEADAEGYIGTLGEWRVKLLESIDMAAPQVIGDSTTYVSWEQSGATSAVRVSLTSTKTGQQIEGWVTCGSYRFPYQLLPVTNLVSLAMAEREPQRYTSNVEVLTVSGEHYQTDIQVNKPFEVEGWKVYQLNYDIERGRWSEISVLELVRDPWLPVVYTGIIMMLLGAVCMFVLAQRKK